MRAFMCESERRRSGAVHVAERRRRSSRSLFVFFVFNLPTCNHLIDATPLTDNYIALVKNHSGFYCSEKLQSNNKRGETTLGMSTHSDLKKTTTTIIYQNRASAGPSVVADSSKQEIKTLIRGVTRFKLKFRPIFFSPPCFLTHITLLDFHRGEEFHHNGSLLWSKTPA